MAAREAVKAFDTHPDASNSLIFTGNILNVTPIPALFSQGMAKSAAAHLLRTADMAYGKKGYSFYYADERKPDGAPAYGDISGDAHADFYLKLAEKTTRAPVQATFVGTTGYVDFSEADAARLAI